MAGLKLGDRPKDGLGSWRMRRRFLWISAVFCMWSIGYVLIQRVDTRAAETAVFAAFICLGTIVGSYVFGAVWQDINLVGNKGGHKDVD